MTYDKVQWTRPRSSRPIRFDKHICLGFIDDLRVASQFPSVTRRPTDVLQLEHDSEDFSNGLHGILDTSTVVETGTVEVVGGRGALRVDGGGVGEFFGLDRNRRLALPVNGNQEWREIKYVKVSILEAGPDTITSLDLQWREIIALWDWSIDGNVTPETRKLRVEA